MAEERTQRRFAVMGENLFRIISKLVDNPIICRLLKYQDSTPLGSDKPDVENGFELINKQIIIVPRIPEEGIECSFIIVVFDQYTINPANPDFKVCRLRFDVVCPYSEWTINDTNLRPYLLMQEIDKTFNQAKLSGLGRLQFTHSVPLTLSPQMGGYSMYYQINEFN